MNVYSPFSVNVCVFPPSTVTFSLSNVIVATTSWFVNSVVLYVIVGTGAFSFSIIFIDNSESSVNISTSPLLPSISTNLNITSFGTSIVSLTFKITLNTIPSSNL